MSNDIETQLRREIVELRGEVRALTAQLEGDIPNATYWLQSKVWRQKKALDTLNRKVLTQRFRLKLLASLGRDVTLEEYEAAKEALQNEQVKDRLEEYEPVVA